jgi:hypothetical protein
VGSFGPALRQAHLDDDCVRAPRQEAVCKIGLPLVAVQVTHDEHKTLSLGVSKKRIDINAPFFHLDRQYPDSPICEGLRHPP